MSSYAYEQYLNLRSKSAHSLEYVIIVIEVLKSHSLINIEAFGLNRKDAQDPGYIEFRNLHFETKKS
jgi:hypothetical protein